MVKKTTLALAALLLCLGAYAQELKQPSKGKCLVYFTRSTSMAFAVGFKLFDEKSYIGKLMAYNVITYECDPGEHVFIARTENTNFLHATLAEGKVYVVDVKANFGIFIARVQFVPTKPSMNRDKRYRKNVLSLLANQQPAEALAEAPESRLPEGMTLSNLLQRFEKRKAAGRVTVLNEEMYFDITADELATYTKKRSRYGDELYE